MEQLKAGDWVIDTRSGMKRPIVQLQPNCIAVTNPEEDGEHYSKWHPNIGEFVWYKASRKSAVLFKWNLVREKHCKSLVGYEPFIPGEIPTFLKELE